VLLGAIKVTTMRAPSDRGADSGTTLGAGVDGTGAAAIEDLRGADCSSVHGKGTSALVVRGGRASRPAKISFFAACQYALALDGFWIYLDLAVVSVRVGWGYCAGGVQAGYLFRG